MWNTLKVIIGIIILVLIGILIFIISSLLAPVNAQEVAPGGVAFPVIGIIVLGICLFLDIKS